MDLQENIRPDYSTSKSGAMRAPAAWRVTVSRPHAIGKWKAFCQIEHAESAMRQWPQQMPYFFDWDISMEPLYTAPVEVSEVLEEVARALERRAVVPHPSSDGYRFAAQLVRSRMELIRPMSGKSGV